MFLNSLKYFEKSIERFWKIHYLISYEENRTIDNCDNRYNVIDGKGVSSILRASVRVMRELRIKSHRWGALLPFYPFSNWSSWAVTTDPFVDTGPIENEHPLRTWRMLVVCLYNNRIFYPLISRSYTLLYHLSFNIPSFSIFISLFYSLSCHRGCNYQDCLSPSTPYSYDDRFTTFRNLKNELFCSRNRSIATFIWSEYKKIKFQQLWY